MSDLIERQTAIDAIAACTVYGNADELEEAVMQGNDWNRWSGGVLEALEAVKEVPSAKPEIMRCKDCIYQTTFAETKIKMCEAHGMHIGNDYDYCSNAIRRTDGKN